MDTRGTLNGGTRPGHIDAGRGNNGRAAAFCVLAAFGIPAAGMPNAARTQNAAALPLFPLPAVNTCACRGALPAPWPSVVLTPRGR